MLPNQLRVLLFVFLPFVLLRASELADQAKVAAAHYDNGEYAKSEAILRAALQHADAGDNASDRAIVWNALALDLRGQGRVAEAEQIYRSTLAAPDISPEARAVVEYDYGRFCLDLGRVPEAEQLAQNAVTGRNSSSLVSAEQRAEAENLLGMVYYATGRIDQAREVFHKALDGAGQSSAAAESLVNLGTMDRHAGNVRDAQAYFLRAIEIARPLTTKREIFATALNDLGLVAQDQGDLKGAKGWLKQSLEAWQAPLGVRRVGYSLTLSNLGVVREKEHQYREARAMYEGALRMDRGIFGANSVTVGMDLIRLGSLLCHTGDEERGKALLAQAAEGQATAAGSRIVRGMANGNLGLVAYRHNDWKEAAAYLEPALRDLRQATAPTDIRRAPFLAAYANTLKHTGQAAEMEETTAELAKVQYNFALHK